MTLPDPNQETLAKRESVIAGLRKIIPGEGVISDTAELKPYECDGLTIYRQLPLTVVLPETTEQVSQVLAFCHAQNVRVVPRGAGTGLSGGALPLGDAVTLSLTRMNRILDIDYENRCVTVQPGVTNLAISQAVDHRGFLYAPDPSSQIACSIGGNVAENAGGVHCLKYGVTANNILGLEMVLMTGDILRLGGKHLDGGAYDLLGATIGSEGLLGVVTEVTVRIIPKPETARATLIGFSSMAEAGQCVADIISAGIIPGGMEIMDRDTIHAVEDFAHVGYPLDVEAVLIVELDGPAAEVEDLIGRVEALAQQHNALNFRASSNEAERIAIWAGRKAAFPAIGRIAADYICMDGTIPRGRLPEVLTRMSALSSDYNLRVANVFHAGDGNLHPLIMFDANDPDELARAEQLGAAILTLCVEVGGVLTGEHGVGVEKRNLLGVMFSEPDMDQQQKLKCAFDPSGLLNPGKVFPTLKSCGELNALEARRMEERFPGVPRF
ncbi:MAG: FAD-linked oxidase C-terminal domain-containing protein [Magnetospiraceae bacterium]